MSDALRKVLKRLHPSVRLMLVCKRWYAASPLSRRKRPVGLSWRMDATYLKVGGQSKYLCRAVDKVGQTIDLHGLPEKITLDESSANTAAIESIRADSGADSSADSSAKIEMR